MAILVKHIESGKKFILLGAGFGMFSTSRPGMLMGNLMPEEKKGEARLIAMPDSSGTIKWFYAKDLAVVEVDGAAPGELLAG